MNRNIKLHEEYVIFQRRLLYRSSLDILRYVIQWGTFNGTYLTTNISLPPMDGS